MARGGAEPELSLERNKAQECALKRPQVRFLLRYDPKDPNPLFLISRFDSMLRHVDGTLRVQCVEGHVLLVEFGIALHVAYRIYQAIP